MDEYAIGGGRLKLKGGPVLEGRVEKRMKKKEKREKKEKEKKEGEGEGEGGERTRTEKKMDTEANTNRNGDGDGDGNTNKDDGQQQHNGSKGEEGVDSVTKTQAERRYEAMKKRRVSVPLPTLLFLQRSLESRVDERRKKRRVRRRSK